MGDASHTENTRTYPGILWVAPLELVPTATLPVLSRTIIDMVSWLYLFPDDLVLDVVWGSE